MMSVLEFGSSPLFGQRSPMVSSSDSKVLFCKHVRVNVRGCRSLTSRCVPLLITIEENVNIMSMQNKELTIKVTDDSDPFLFYTSSITETEFQTLKQSQGLLIDFLKFPQQLINLLESGVEEELKMSPRFLLQLNISSNESNLSSKSSSACLEIVETNPFKHLTHLSLRLSSLDDVTLKKFLLSNFQSLKIENEKLSRTIQVLQNDVQILSQERNERTSELNGLKNRFDQELSDRERNMAEQIHKLRHDFESLKNKSSNDENEISRLKNELEEKDSRMRSLFEQVSQLTDSITNEDEIKNMIIKLQTSAEELEEKVIQKEEQLVQKTDEIEALTSDLNKANEIIRKLQNEVIRTQSKLDLLNKVSSKQDHLVTEKDNKLRQLEHDLKLCCQRLKKKETESQEKENEVINLKEQLNESRETIKTNENLISWLNKQLASLKPCPSSPPKTSRPMISRGNNGLINGGAGQCIKNGRVENGNNRMTTIAGRPIGGQLDDQMFTRNCGIGDSGDPRTQRMVNPMAAIANNGAMGSRQADHLLPQVNLNDKYNSQHHPGISNHHFFSKK